MNYHQGIQKAAWLLLGFLATISLGAIPTADALTLTYEDVIRRAVENSPEVRRATAELGLANTDEPSVLASTDPEFIVSGLHRFDETPRAVPQIFGTRTISEVFSAGFKKRTLIGTEISLLADTTQQDTNANPFFRPVNPTIDSSLSLSISQSLLKNFWGRPDRARRAQARAGVRAAQARLARAQDVAGLFAGEAFLDFVAADKETALRREAALDAQRFLNTIKEKRAYSLVEESDLAQAQVNLELRKLEEESAVSRRKQARLKLLMAIHANEALARDERVEVDWDFPSSLPDPEPRDLATVLAERPDIQALTAREEATAARYRLQRLQRLPNLTALGSYGYAGLKRSYENSLKDLESLNHPVYTAGIALTIPITAARERVAEKVARLDLEIAKADRAQLEALARLEILGTREQLAQARKQLATTEAIVALQQRKLKAERRNFERGRSTTEVLIRFAEEERGARRELLYAKTSLVKALLALRYSQGDPIGRPPPGLEDSARPL